MLPYYETIHGDFSFIEAHHCTFPIHFHTQVEIIYVTKGTADIVIDGTLFYLQAGDLGIIFPGLSHEYHAQSPDGTELMAIFQPKFTPQFSRVLTESKPECPILKESNCHPDIHYAMRSLQIEFCGSSPNPQIFSIFLQLLTTRIMPSLKLQKRETDENTNLKYRLTDYLTHHFQEPITLSDAAIACGVSKGYLSKVFTQQMGSTFPHYLNNLRINEAQFKLRSTTLPITEISFNCGFESLRTFNRNFTKIVGMTPGEYRKSLYE